MELGTLLKIPSGTPGLKALEIDLSEILSIESRQREIAYVNKETAPELMYSFNRAYTEILKNMTKIMFEYNQATKYANKRRSVVLLDVAPEVLKIKGLVSKKSMNGSADLRQAVLDQDDEYLDLLDKVNLLKAAHEYLRSKAKGFEMSYYAVRKVMDSSHGGIGSYHTLHPLSEKVDPETKSITDLIGEPKF